MNNKGQRVPAREEDLPYAYIARSVTERAQQRQGKAGVDEPSRDCAHRRAAELKGRSHLIARSLVAVEEEDRYCMAEVRLVLGDGSDVDRGDNVVSPLPQVLLGRRELRRVLRAGARASETAEAGGREPEGTRSASATPPRAV